MDGADCMMIVQKRMVCCQERMLPGSRRKRNAERLQLGCSCSATQGYMREPGRHVLNCTPEGQEAVDHDDQRGGVLVDGVSKATPALIRILEQLHQRQREHPHAQQRRGKDEAQEPLVVALQRQCGAQESEHMALCGTSGRGALRLGVHDRDMITSTIDKQTHPADAGANPRTVVVELVHAVVAHRAVAAPRRPVVVARGAPLCGHCEAVDLELLRRVPPPVWLDGQCKALVLRVQLMCSRWYRMRRISPLCMA